LTPHTDIVVAVLAVTKKIEIYLQTKFQSDIWIFGSVVTSRFKTNGRHIGLLLPCPTSTLLSSAAVIWQCSC